MRPNETLGSGSDPKPLPAKEWWKRRRLRYNVGLTIAGFSAFGCYIAVLEWGSSIGAIQHANYHLILQGTGYLLAMAIANLCYSIGPIAERIVKPRDVERYRAITFRLGFWFSVLLPFSVPAFLACLCLTRP